MNSLPEEIYVEIFSHLPHRYFYTLSLTCQRFARLVKPVLFATLVLHGDAQSRRYPSTRDSDRTPYTGSTKSVELAHLNTVVEELLDLDVARYVKRFKFSPKFYHRSMTVPLDFRI